MAWLPGQALAHAHLAQSVPADGATVPSALPAIELTFTEAVEVKFSGLVLTGPDKRDVATGAPALKPGDARVLVVPLIAPLAGGAYAVGWHVLSRDGHRVKGSLTFTVSP